MVEPNNLDSYMSFFRKAYAKLMLTALMLTAFLFIPCLAGADISVSLILDRKEALLSNSIRMVVSVSGTRKSSSHPAVYGLEHFNVTEAGSSSRIEIINSKVNSGIEYTYFIQPKKTGTFRIGPAEFKFKGRIFKSGTQTLTVLKTSSGVGDDRGPLFLTCSISPSEVYVEGQAFYTLKLYLRARVSDISLDLPETDHLTFTQLGKPTEYQTACNGKNYQVLEIRYVMIPSKQGEFIIQPSKMHMNIHETGRGSHRDRDRFFSDPFFSSVRPATLTSKPLELKVIPLPNAKRPDDFSGLVGSFKIKSTLAPAEIKVGESATLTVLFSGHGNVKRIPDLKVPEMAGAKIYTDQTELIVKTDSKGLTGSKTMRWAIVPEKHGVYQIPPLSVSFFDTTKHEYRVIRTSPHSLKVVPGKTEHLWVSRGDAGNKTTEGPPKAAVKELGHDILPVHTSIKDLTLKGLSMPHGLLLWVVLIAPCLVYGATFVVLHSQKRSPRSLTALKAKKAARTFVQQCRHSRVLPRDVSLAVRDYLNDRLDLSLGSLTPGDAEEILPANGVSHETAHKLQSMLEKIENLVYTGKGNETCDINEDLIKVIRQIEKEIR